MMSADRRKASHWGKLALAVLAIYLVVVYLVMPQLDWVKVHRLPSCDLHLPSQPHASHAVREEPRGSGLLAASSPALAQCAAFTHIHHEASQLFSIKSYSGKRACAGAHHAGPRLISSRRDTR